MKSDVDVCCTCLRFDVKYYQLDDSIRPPPDLPFDGCEEFHGTLQKILKLDGEAEQLTSVICQTCNDEFRRIYHFMHRCVESEMLLSQLKEVNIRLQRLKAFPMVVNIKRETDEFLENEDADKRNSPSIADNIRNEDSTSSCIPPLVAIKEEYDNNFTVTAAVKDLNSDLPLMENFDTVESNATQVNMNPVDAQKLFENSQQLKMEEEEEEVVIEVWITGENETFETKIQENVSRTKHSGKTYECDECHSKFRSRSQLYKHKPLHKGTFKCDQCDAEYTRKDSLRFHQLSQAGVSFKCNLCSAQFSTKCHLSQHQLTHWNRKYACDRCDAKYTHNSGLKKHKIANHSSSKKLLQCDQCNATFKSKQGFDYHCQSHTGFMYECDQCDAKFKSKRGINNHKVSHTGLKCDLCHAPFPSEGIIKRHVEVSWRRNLTCDQCNIKNVLNVPIE